MRCLQGTRGPCWRADVRDLEKDLHPVKTPGWGPGIGSIPLAFVRWPAAAPPVTPPPCLPLSLFPSLFGCHGRFPLLLRSAFAVGTHRSSKLSSANSPPLFWAYSRIIWCTIGSDIVHRRSPEGLRPCGRLTGEYIPLLPLVAVYSSLASPHLLI